jgi:glycosyltransferase involved in cell wall biosynthesis
VARISREKGILEALLFLRAAQLNGRVEVDFYGAKQNPAYLKECEDVAATMPDFKIAFHGEITPNELPAKLDQAHFFYMPTLGENYGHAIVEALTHCTPVIISDRTPWRNLARLNAGWDLPLNAEAFGPVLQHCLQMENDEYKMWCDKAYDHGCAEAKSPETLAAAYALFD